MPVIAAGAPIGAGWSLRAPARALAGTVSVRTLLCLLFALLALPQPLLWLFLGFSPLAAAGGAGAVAALAVGFARTVPPGSRIQLRKVAIAVSVSLIVFVLGGEGRFFYANTDWQVRDAVMRDLAIRPWPFVYASTHGPLVLRLPLAMYLTPALAGKIGGYRAAEFAMLAQHTVMLACLLSVGASLFEGRRARATALAVVLLFSGMDAIGAYLTRGTIRGHLESWAGPQFSSHITQAFWVPQHGLAGWIGALGYLLWRNGRLGAAGFLLIVPLTALWSPLATMGLLPFAAHVGIATITRRRLTPADIALPAVATLLSLPGLLYMLAGSGAVGGRLNPPALDTYLLLELLEVLPFLVAAAAIGGRSRFGGVTLAIVAASLLVAPYIQVGHSGDFVMRASIPSLAILSVIIADALVSPVPATALGLWRPLLLGTLAVGAITPLSETFRAVTEPPSPAPLCSYLGVVPSGDATYDVPLATLPAPVRPAAPARVQPHDPRRCWARLWPLPDDNGLQ